MTPLNTYYNVLLHLARKKIIFFLDADFFLNPKSVKENVRENIL